MRKKATIPTPVDRVQPYIMGIADTLSDDPMLLHLLGGNFKVIADYDLDRRRVTYSFRRLDDVELTDDDAMPV